MGAFPPHQLRLLREVVVPLLLTPQAEVPHPYGHGPTPLDLRLLTPGSFDRPEVTRELVAVLAAEMEAQTDLTVRRASAVLFARRVFPGALYLAVLPVQVAELLAPRTDDVVAQAHPELLLRNLLSYGGVLLSPPIG